MLDSTDGARRRDVSTRVTRTPHDELGLTVDDVLSMFRIAILARLIDEAAFRQNRMGRAPFVVPVSGHEGCQIGTAWAMRRAVVKSGLRKVSVTESMRAISNPTSRSMMATARHPRRSRRRRAR